MSSGTSPIDRDDELLADIEEAGTILTPNLREVFSAAMNDTNPETQGQQLGNFLSGMMRQIREVPADNPVVGMQAIFTAMLGEEASARVMREIEIRKFFKDKLVSSNLEEAKRLTQEQFQLPTGFSIEVPLTITFGPVADKAVEPDLD